MKSKCLIAAILAACLTPIVARHFQGHELFAQAVVVDSFEQEATDDAAWAEQFAWEDQVDAETEAAAESVELAIDETAEDALAAAVDAAAVPSRVRGFNTAQLLNWIDADGNPVPATVPCPSPTPTDPGATTPRTQLDCALTLMAASGSTLQRLLVYWADVQPTPVDLADAHWNKYDTLIGAATTAGITRLILTPVGSPNWARDAERRTDPMNKFSIFAHPDKGHFPAWKRFVAAVASRYPTAAGYEIGNEENTNNFWDATKTNGKPSPTAYAALFCAASDAIHAVRSTARVGVGGLAPIVLTNLDPPKGKGDKVFRANRFLQGAFEHGVGEHGCRVDFVGYHPYATRAYCTTTPPNIANTPPMTELGKVRDQMVAFGHGAEKAWITEWGFPSRGYPQGTSECNYTPARQTRLIRLEHNYLARLSYTAFSGYFNLLDDAARTR